MEPRLLHAQETNVRWSLGSQRTEYTEKNYLLIPSLLVCILTGYLCVCVNLREICVILKSYLKEALHYLRDILKIYLILIDIFIGFTLRQISVKEIFTYVLS